ncbi:unnamed protein product [Owenia fusiformis]|uniref:Uncharacterized protein n=1 Tax=Owenia fusiformis TaxID=6347 RepID=A0A8J1Y6Q3_OWEFU|nr:unnamed protein product [Owenia fusiformis]
MPSTRGKSKNQKQTKKKSVEKPYAKTPSDSSNEATNSNLKESVETLTKAVNILVDKLEAPSGQSDPPVPTPSSSAERNLEPLDASSSTIVRGLGEKGIHPNDIPMIDVISPSVKRAILTGKYINMACLLIPYYEISKAPSLDTEADGKLTLKAVNMDNDPKLKRHLTIAEFITAFEKYKRIMLAAYPSRADELSQYMYNILDIHNTNGAVFYEYHKLFTGRACAAWINHQIKVDWGQVDTRLLQLVLNSKHVDVDNGKTSQSEAKRGKQNTDRQGRKVIYSEDERGRSRPVCNNFNSEGGCNYDDCYRLHVRVDSEGRKISPSSRSSRKNEGKNKN